MEPMGEAFRTFSIFPCWAKGIAGFLLKGSIGIAIRGILGV